MFKRLLLVLLFISNVVSANTISVPRKLVISHNVTLRSNSYFSGKSYVIGFLSRGIEAEILEIDTNKSKGVGLKIKITSGPNFGRIGWIYYHKDPRSRVMNLFDQSGKRISPSSSEFKSYFNKTSNLIGLDNFKKENEDEVWDKIRSGQYEITTEDDQGGPYLEYKKPVYNRKGERYYVIMQTPRRLEKLQELIDPKSITTYLDECNKEDISQLTEVDSEEVMDHTAWLPHCSVLSKAVTENDTDELSLCLQSIKDTVLKGNRDRRGLPSNRNAILTNLFLKLNPKEQEFAALTLTAFGEAGILTPPEEEMVAVMKVIRNRRDYARKYGHENATDLDAAIQPWQFSMYNANDNNWKEALRASPKNKFTQRAVSAFVKFKNAKYRPPEIVDNVYHYHREYVKTAAWSRGKRPASLTINDVKISAGRRRHDFFKDIAWSFKLSSYRKKADQILKQGKR